MMAVETLCTKAMIISSGRSGPILSVTEGVGTYLQSVASDSALPLDERKDRTGRGSIRFRQIAVRGNQNLSDGLKIGEDLHVFLEIENRYPTDVNVRLVLSISTAHGDSLISCDSRVKGGLHLLPQGTSRWICKLHEPPLNNGEYYLNIAVFYFDEPQDWIIMATRFQIEAGTFDDHTIDIPKLFPILCRFEWELEDQSR
jgi:hypothetical protein